MDEPTDEPRQPPGVTIKCSMCQQRVPVLQSRTVSGRPLCFGCLSDWYGEDEDEA